MSSLKSKRAIPENGNQKGKGFTSMDSTTAQRRLNIIHAHLVSAVDSAFSHSHLRSSPTAAEFLSEQNYSVVLPEKLQTGKWNVYRSARSPLKLVSRFPDHPDIGTLHDNFLLAVDFFGDNNYLGTRIRVDGTVGEYKWMTYREAATARTAIGCGLIHHGILKGSCIGLYFINRPEWIIVDHACSAYSLISVPLYDTLGPDAVKYIINHAELKAVFCVPQTLNPVSSTIQWCMHDLKFAEHFVRDSICSFDCGINLPHLSCQTLTFLFFPNNLSMEYGGSKGEEIKVVGGMENEVPSLPSSTGIQIVTYSRLLNQGRSYLQPFCQPKPDDIATICYTSGTTGTPKGVVLTHGNLIANAAGFSLAVKFNPTDVYISYLPLAHIFERFNQINLAHYGVAVGFYQGDNMRLMDDLASLRPTLFCSVPRLYNRIYAGY
ncbi:hypothetical protein Gogos_020603 [Gossypium gossypioides]|uniref:AMP-dependent synthetase/ligase domain-containing protein n=1 Tax=Gossypium gossypioides TaxID=34282 RepID=A0A7J9D5H5_GOSGO|nr:hypothetical protein [Gossypium gossypioides]